MADVAAAIAATDRYCGLVQAVWRDATGEAGRRCGIRGGLEPAGDQGGCSASLSATAC